MQIDAEALKFEVVSAEKPSGRYESLRALDVSFHVRVIVAAIDIYDVEKLSF